MTLKYSHMAHNNQTKIMRYKPQMEEKIIETMKATAEFTKPRIKEGFYPCECVNVKKVTEGEYGKRIAIICKILDDKEVELAKVNYLKLTSGSGLTKVLEAFGIPFEDGKKFDFGELIGKQSTAVVEDYTYFADNEERSASTITKFKPFETKVEDVK